MKRIGTSFVSAVTIAALAFCASAHAQKSKDTLRVGVYQPIAIIDAIFDPQPQTNMMDRVVFDTLVNYDSDNRKYLPGLALSWKRVDKLTTDFKLRQGVKFHDGSEFDADDVVYTFAFVTDPKVKFRFKGTRFGHIDKVTKVDKYTIRITTKKPYAAMISRLTTSPPIFPSDYHSKLEKKNAFGRKPIGTGPYKAIQVDASKGVILVKNADYKHGNAGKPAAKIGRVVIREVPDTQTQVARMMTGQQDIMYQVPKDIAEFLGKNPDLSISVRPTVMFAYFIPDAADRSKIGIFKDKRVREAFMMAIDRKAIVKALQPKAVADMPLQQSMCHSWHIGCASSLNPPSFNPEKAKQLLKEAGVPPGFKIGLTTWGPSIQIAEAVAGQLRKIGITASVDKHSIGGFVKKRARGQVQAFVSLWDNGGAAPDIDSTAGFFFLPGSRNYNGDKSLAKLVLAGKAELDGKKRDAIYKKLFDTATRERYAMPVVPLAAVIAHRKDVVVPKGGTKKPEGFMFNLVSWK